MHSGQGFRAAEGDPRRKGPMTFSQCADQLRFCKCPRTLDKQPSGLGKLCDASKAEGPGSSAARQGRTAAPPQVVTGPDPVKPPRSCWPRAGWFCPDGMGGQRCCYKRSFGVTAEGKPMYRPPYLLPHLLAAFRSKKERQDRMSTTSKAGASLFNTRDARYSGI